MYAYVFYLNNYLRFLWRLGKVSLKDPQNFSVDIGPARLASRIAMAENKCVTWGHFTPKSVEFWDT